jgi:hypothetical protein
MKASLHNNKDIVKYLSDKGGANIYLQNNNNIYLFYICMLYIYIIFFVVVAVYFVILNLKITI